MATVTGMTAAAMQAIKDGAIVGVDFDSANHLILTKNDGTTIDGGVIGTATTTLQGVVELATSAETQTGTDATRVVTPAGLASLPGTRVQVLTSNGIAESSTSTSYPTGTSVMTLTTGSAWTPNGGFGLVVTEKSETDRTVQTFYANSGSTSTPKVWVREYNAGWTSWAQTMLMVNLTPGSFTQATTRGNYPTGTSRLYYTAGTAGSWDFASIAPGEVITYIADDANFFGRQIFTSHAGGTSNPVQWFRTANQAGGWTAWQPVITDPGAWIPYTPVWTSAGTGTPSFGSNSTIDCRSHKLGRKVEVKFEVTFGSTATFGNTGTGDNWQFTLPYPAARSGDHIGWLELHGTGNSAICLGRSRTNSTTTFLTGVVSGQVGGAVPAQTGDVDSITPYTWTSGMSLKGGLVYESAA